MSREVMNIGGFQIRDMNELMETCVRLSKSEIVPKNYRGKPEDIFTACMLGHHLGLNPFSALNGICVINGKTAIYGDILLSLVMAHPDCEDVIEEQLENGTGWKCTVNRKNRTPTVRYFTMDDAKKAGLLGKSGPWTSYPQRMLQMRARGFALRDSFPDALNGIVTAEEAEDYQIKDVTPKKPYSVPANITKQAPMPMIENKSEESIPAVRRIDTSIELDVLNLIEEGIKLAAIQDNYLDRILMRLNLKELKELTQEQANKIMDDINSKCLKLSMENEVAA